MGAKTSNPLPIIITDSYGNPQTVNPVGDVRVALPSSQLFTETFDTGWDSNQWVATASGTGAIAAPQTVGSALLTGGTALNAFSKFTTAGMVPPFRPTQPGFLLNQSNLNIPFPVPTTAYDFFGQGTSSATPTIAAPVINGVGWEIGTGGLLLPVTYASSARLALPFVAANQPVDSAAHKYFHYFKGDICYWCIDDKDNVVATFQTGASGPDVNSLPLLYQVISNSGTAATLQINGVTVGDTAHSTIRISDATYLWRQQTVGNRGDAVISLMDGNKTTYSCSTTAAAGVVGDTFVITGSATKTVRVTRVSISATSGAAVDVDVSVVKRSTADTGGTSTAVTVAPHDSANAAATATVALYTVVPTPGTTVGSAVRVGKLFAPLATTSAVAATPLIWDFGNGPKQGIVLRGIAQQLAINLGSALTTGSIDIDMEFTEE